MLMTKTWGLGAPLEHPLGGNRLFMKYAPFIFKTWADIKVDYDEK